MKTVLEENKVSLNETIKGIMQDYVDVVMRARITEVYGIFGDSSVLRALPMVDCGEFTAHVNKILGEHSQLGQGLIFLNAVLKSDNVELLRSSCLYKDVLDGRVCSKPANEQECIDIIREMQRGITAEYNNIVNALELYHVQTLGDTGLCVDENESGSGEGV